MQQSLSKQDLIQQGQRAVESVCATPSGRPSCPEASRKALRFAKKKKPGKRKNHTQRLPTNRPPRTLTDAPFMTPTPIQQDEDDDGEDDNDEEYEIVSSEEEGHINKRLELETVPDSMLQEPMLVPPSLDEEMQSESWPMTRRQLKQQLGEYEELFAENSDYMLGIPFGLEENTKY